MEEFPEEVRSALKSVIDKNGLHDFNIVLSSASNKGDNYMGSLHLIEATGVRNHARSVLNLVCKVPPSDWKTRENMNIGISYEREIFLYNVVLERFKRFQLEKRIPSDEMFAAYARCYAAEIGDDYAYLILEDLTARSFVMHDKFRKLDRPHVELILRNLARFHANSFAMKDQKPDEFKDYTDLPEVAYEVLGERGLMDLCYFGLEQAIKVVDETEPNHADRLRKIKKNCEEIMRSCLRGIGKNGDYRVLTHGDCWNNNMMFRYENGTPVEVRFIDWQITRYSTPILDLAYFFYVSTERQILEGHFDDLMDFFYDQLSKSVRVLGSDPEKLYPYRVFRDDWKEFGKFGIIMCSFALNFILADSETAPNVMELGDVSEDNNRVEGVLGFKSQNAKTEYDRRIRDVVKHAADRNFI